MMKRILFAVCVLAFAALATAAKRPIKIQVSTFPATIHATWNPNAASDNVVDYLVTVGSASPVTVPVSVCATSCISPITIPAAGTYTISVVAQNLLVSSDPTSTQSSAADTVTVQVNGPPGTPTGLKGGK